jgi:hypothetical protein
MVFSYFINCFIKLRSLVSAARSLLPLERERGRRGGERESTGESEKNMGLRRKMILFFFFLNDGRKSINGVFSISKVIKVKFNKNNTS